MGKNIFKMFQQSVYISVCVEGKLRKTLNKTGPNYIKSNMIYKLDKGNMFFEWQQKLFFNFVQLLLVVQYK